MLLAKSRPIVVISMTGGSHFARECLMAFTPWHLDAVSGSHPPHLLWCAFRTHVGHRATSEKGHVWTAPAVQEESDVLRSVRVQPCIRPVFEWKSDLHCDAAAVAAGPDVIR